MLYFILFILYPLSYFLLSNHEYLKQRNIITIHLSYVINKREEINSSDSEINRITLE